MRRFTLERRLTNRYVDAYRHLDKWEDIGTATIVGESPVKHTDEEDACDPTTQTLFIEVESEAEVDDVRRALNASLTQSGCSHQHDCCGCRSYFATATHLKDNLWKVVKTSSRNY